MKKFIASFCFANREWSQPSIGHDDPDWKGFYFHEFVIDWSIFPPNSYGQLYVETMHVEIPSSEGKPAIREGGEIRVAYQYKPHAMIPIEESIIKTYIKTSARWQLLSSEWFKIPSTPDVACVWIEGKSEPGKNISLALATLVIAEEVL